MPDYSGAVTAPARTRAPASLRLAEVLTALALATDAGNGFPLEKSLRVAVVAVRLGERAGLTHDELADAYYVALLRSLGCTAYSPETAALLGGDDIAFHTLFEQLDPGRPVLFLREVVTGMGAWAPPLERARSVARFLTVGPREGRKAGRAACEVSVVLARRLGLPPGVQAGLNTIYERWDGRGIPDGVTAEQVALAARVTQVADIAVIAHGEGADAAAAVAARRAGHFDPAIADAFDAELLDGLADADALELALHSEPAPAVTMPRTKLPDFAAALGDFGDLKSFWTVGHTRRVAELSASLAGHVHDIGRVAVPNSVWDKPGPLGAAEWDRVRLHPFYTERILSRVPALAPMAGVAASHHERCDGSGYHRHVDGGALDGPARTLAAADAYAAMTAHRPHRPALGPDAAARELRSEAAAGRLCPDAVERVLVAAGHIRERHSWPCGLTEREVEVLRLLTRGLTNKQIAADLVVSPRTVQHHVAHVYDKIDRRTRAGAALFAMERGIAR